MAEAIEKKKVRLGVVLGLLSGANLSQAFTVLRPRFVRRLVLVNPTSRLKPSIVTRSIDWLERFLPLGLPLGRLSRGFDSRPFLHRIRCPVLILLTSEASHYEKSEEAILSRSIPNAWATALPTSRQELHLPAVVSLIKEFFEVPVKRPQKNVQRAVNL